MDQRRRLEKAIKYFSAVHKELMKFPALKLTGELLEQTRWQKEGQESERVQLRILREKPFKERVEIMEEVYHMSVHTKELLEKTVQNPNYNESEFFFSLSDITFQFLTFEDDMKSLIQKTIAYTQKYGLLDAKQKEILQRAPHNVRLIRELVTKAVRQVTEASYTTRKIKFGKEFMDILKEKVFNIHKKSIKRKKLQVGPNTVFIEIIYHPESFDEKSFSIHKPLPSLEGVSFKEKYNRLMKKRIQKTPEEEKAQAEKQLLLSDKEMINEILNVYMLIAENVITKNPQLVRAHKTQIKILLTTGESGVNGSFNPYKSSEQIFYFQHAVNYNAFFKVVWAAMTGERDVEPSMLTTLTHEFTHAYDWRKNTGTKAEEFLRGVISGPLAPATESLAEIYDSLRSEGLAIISEKLITLFNSQPIPTVIFDYEFPRCVDALRSLRKEIDELGTETKAEKLSYSVNQTYHTGLVHHVGEYLSTTIILYKLREHLHAFLCPHKDIPSSISAALKKNFELGPEENFELDPELFSKLIEEHHWQYIPQKEIGHYYKVGEGLNITISCSKEKIRQAITALSLMKTKEFFEAFWKAAEYFKIPTTPFGKEDIIQFNKKNLHLTKKELQREGFT